MTQESPKGAQRPPAATQVPMPPPPPGGNPMKDETPDQTDFARFAFPGEIVPAPRPGDKDWVMPNHVPIEPISAEQELRALALTAAVERHKHTNTSDRRIFELADKMLQYIKTGEYARV